MKRQRSRNRGNGGGKPQHNANRAFESNGPEGVKIRGAAQHVFEKYQQLARDALTAGDRVLAESYQQHAEHYFRVLRAMQPQRSAQDIIGRDAFASGFDIDFEDESGAQAEAEAAAEGGETETEGRGEWRQDRPERQDRFEGRPRDDRQRDDRNRDRNFNRDDRPRNERGDRYRDDRPRDDRPRDERQRDERQRDERPYREDRYRDDRPRDERPRDDRPREERQRDDRQRDDRPREGRDERPRYDRGERAADPLAVVEPQASPLTSEAEPAAASPILRSQDGGVSEAPAFLQAAAPRAEPAAEDAEPRPRARRRRAPRSFEATGGEEGAAAEAEEA